MGEYSAVECDHAGSVVIQSVPVAALLICIKIDPADLKVSGCLSIPITYLRRRFLDEVDSFVELP